MLILKDLRWGKCFSYGDNNHLPLHQHQITQLLGDNGAGKTSIPLILEEAISNKNSKGIKKTKIPNRMINDGYWITLDFDDGDSTYKVHIERKSGIKVRLEKDGEDISSHTATNTFKQIEEVFGRSMKVISQLIYQGNTSSLKFLTETDTNRKKFLIELFDLDQYTAMGEAVKLEIKDAEARVSSIQGEINTISRWIQRADNTDLELMELQQEPALDSTLSEKVSLLEGKVSIASSENKRINANNRLRKQLEDFDFAPIERAKGLEKQPTTELSEQVGVLKGRMAAAADTFSKLKDLGQGECPTCLQEIDANEAERMLNEAKEQYRVAKAEKEELEQSISSILRQNKIVEEGSRKERDLQELHRALDSDCPEDLIDVSDLKRQIAELKQQQSDQQRQRDEVRQANAKAEAHNSRVSLIQEQRAEYEAQLVSAKAELAAAEEVVSDLSVLRKAFSTNGLVAYKLENLTSDLETLTNEYLGELSDGRFSLAFELEKDKLNVSLSDNGDFIDIQELSSGELGRVNTATLLAIRKLMSSITKTSINVLFLDEVISVLDTEARDKLVEVLVQEPHLNTFLISHGWEHPLLEKVVCLKEGGISRLEK